MAYRCDLCDKKTHAGRQHTHHAGVAGGQWKKKAQKTLRNYAPNLHYATIPINGVMTRVRACTKCIKRVRFDAKKAVKGSITTS
ncbi:TPA: 50S ribosomal protein L28 [Patescibacteria group bacterium]|nr:50S ribosomal protein L28 [Patescibacteria group bacterium]